MRPYWLLTTALLCGTAHADLMPAPQFAIKVVEGTTCEQAPLNKVAKARWEKLETCAQRQVAVTRFSLRFDARGVPTLASTDAKKGQSFDSAQLRCLQRELLALRLTPAPSAPCLGVIEVAVKRRPYHRPRPNGSGDPLNTIF